MKELEVQLKTSGRGEGKAELFLPLPGYLARLFDLPSVLWFFCSVVVRLPLLV